MPALDPRLWSVLGNGTNIGSGAVGASNEDLQTALGFAKQYDPNASIQWNSENPYLSFNNALLPQNVLGGHGIERIARMPGSGERLGNAGLTFNDPTFGQVTTPWNLREKGPSMVDILGPLLVGGAAALGGGGFSWISSLMQKAPQMGQMLSSVLGGGGPAQGPLQQQMTPQQSMLLQLLARHNQMSGG